MTEPITKDEVLKTLKFAREIADLEGKSDILAATHATLTRLFPAMPGYIDITAKTYTVKPHPPEAETTVTVTLTTTLDGLYYLDYELNQMAEEAGMY
jgi:hypothetical protein|nr:MAG TPA: hypothetical protein [Caudoviricetes sp.]